MSIWLIFNHVYLNVRKHLRFNTITNIRHFCFYIFHMDFLYFYIILAHFFNGVPSRSRFLRHCVCSILVKESKLIQQITYNNNNNVKEKEVIFNKNKTELCAALLKHNGHYPSDIRWTWTAPNVLCPPDNDFYYYKIYKNIIINEAKRKTRPTL